MFKQTKEINMYILKYKNKQLVKSLWYIYFLLGMRDF